MLRGTNPVRDPNPARNPKDKVSNGAKDKVSNGANSRLGNNVRITGADLTAAINAALASQQVNAEQKPSMGCNIKRKQKSKP